MPQRLTVGEGEWKISNAGGTSVDLVEIDSRCREGRLEQLIIVEIVYTARSALAMDSAW